MAKSFPQRKDRKELLEQLKKLTMEDVANQKSYESFVSCLTKLDNRLNQLSEIDEKTGLAPTVDTKMREDLMNLYAEAGMAGEKYLAEIAAQMRPKESVTTLVNSLQGLMARDYDTLQLYNPAEPKSMPELLEQSRTRTIDLRGRNIKTLGNSQNSRIPMALKNAEGERRNGVFTKATRVHVTGTFQEVLEKAKEACGPQGKAELDGFLMGYKDYLIRNMETTRNYEPYTDESHDNLIIGRMLMSLRSSQDVINEESVRTILSQSSVDLTAISSKGLKLLTAGLRRMNDLPENEINGFGLQLREGERLDSRNAAMSAMAGMLGVPNLVARAEPMRFIDDSNKVIEGTFMEFAKGLDLYNHPEQRKHLKRDQKENSVAQNNLKKALSDLQVVDYLCLNVDRHEGNLSYVVNEEGYVTGVQAFDNDSSFGVRDAQNSELKQFQVMSKSMSERVKSLTPEMLRFGLRGHGLSNRELDSAVARLKGLQFCLRSKSIKVVEDDKFDLLSSKELSGRRGDNFVTETLHFVNVKVTNYIEENHVGFVPYKGEGPQLSEVASTDRRFTMGGVMDAGDRVGRLLHDKDDGFKVGFLTSIRGSSKEFRQMVRAAKDLVNLQNQLKTQNSVDERKLMDEAGNEPILTQIDEKYQALETKINAYFQRKMGQIHNTNLDTLQGRNAYEDRRIQYAKKLMAAVKDFKDIRSGKLTEEAKADKEALASQREQQQQRQKQKPQGPVLP